MHASLTLYSVIHKTTVLIAILNYSSIIALFYPSLQKRSTITLIPSLLRNLHWSWKSFPNISAKKENNYSKFGFCRGDNCEKKIRLNPGAEGLRQFAIYFKTILLKYCVMVAPPAVLLHLASALHHYMYQDFWHWFSKLSLGIGAGPKLCGPINVIVRSHKGIATSVYTHELCILRNF